MRCLKHGTFPYSSGTDATCPLCTKDLSAKEREPKPGYLKCVYCGKEFRYIIWNKPEPPPPICSACETPKDLSAKEREPKPGYLKCVYCGKEFRYIIWNKPEPPPPICSACETPMERARRAKEAKGKMP